MSTTASERAWCVMLPHRAWGARLARRRLTLALTGLVSGDLLEDAEAVVSELIGNAVRHAAPLPGGVVRIVWQLRGHVVEIRVSDGGSAAAPEVLDVAPDSVSGRGLTIVAALARRWGSERDDFGQCVWAQVG